MNSLVKKWRDKQETCKQWFYSAQEAVYKQCADELEAELALNQQETLSKSKAGAELEAQGGEDAKRTGTVDDISDRELLRRAVSSLARLSDRKKRPLWARVMDLTSLGSTYSAQLCIRYGYDPDKYKEQSAAQAKEQEGG